MVRSVHVQVALACSLFLGTTPAVTVPVSQDLAAAIEIDSECKAESSSSLELSQLRAKKLHAVEWGEAGPAKPSHAKDGVALAVTSHVSHAKSEAAVKSSVKNGQMAHTATSHAKSETAHKSSAKTGEKQVKASSTGKKTSRSNATAVHKSSWASKSKAGHKSRTKTRKTGGKRVKASGAAKKTSRSKGAAAHKSSKSSKESPDYGHPAWLSSCKRIFLDIGANIGVNIRKLFEAHKYTGSKLLPFMDQHFGELTTRQAPGEQSGLCALGLEPNPEHRERLHALEEAYSNKGWRVHFYPFAAWDSEGEMPLNTTSARVMSEADIFHRGAHLSMNLAEGQPVLASSLVRTVNLANFIDSLPQHSVSLALMDIEGSEYETLAQLMMEKKLCQSTILNLLVEAHEWGDIAKWGEPTSFSQGVHPRSTMAIGERLSQMAAMGWCPEGDGVTYVAKLDDFSYASDVDDNFGTR